MNFTRFFGKLKKNKDWGDSMAYHITVLPQQMHISAEVGENLLSCLRRAGMAVDAPCGGEGKCGKCRVLIDGCEALACHTVINRDIVVTLPASLSQQILTDGRVLHVPGPVREGWLLTFDIGTTTVVGYLLHDGTEVACESRSNPQAAFGADVVSRIGHALEGQMQALTGCIRTCLEDITLSLCQVAKLDAAEIGIVSFVGNPTMQQLFLGLDVENLAKIPFAPVLTEASIVSAREYLPCCENAKLLIVPDLSGFVGADTLACVLSTGMHQQEEMTLLVDIGTNGEMVLGNRHRMLACSTAAGPALEGANIGCGMRGQNGAIDHVRLENNVFRCSVIGEGKATGICGSGLIDAVAAALKAGLLNSRGRIQNESRRIDLTDNIFLTQEDIRQLQLAKGAIRAGIELLAQQMGITPEQIDRVYLAGAFGSFMDVHSACRIGLLPPQLAGKITAVGNAAGSGAKLLAMDENALRRAQQLVEQIEFVELAALPNFPKTFARQMGFALHASFIPQNEGGLSLGKLDHPCPGGRL